MLDTLPAWLDGQAIICAVWNARDTVAQFADAVTAAPGGEYQEVYQFYPDTWTGKYSSLLPRTHHDYYEGVLRVVSADAVGDSRVTLLCEWQSTFPGPGQWGQMQIHLDGSGAAPRLVGAWTFVGAGIIGGVSSDAVTAHDPLWSQVVLLIQSTPGSSSFDDRSPHHTEHPVSVAGVTFGAAETLPGGAEIVPMSFSGSHNGLSTPAHPDWNFGELDFTIEGWFRRPDDDSLPRGPIIGMYIDDPDTEAGNQNRGWFVHADGWQSATTKIPLSGFVGNGDSHFFNAGPLSDPPANVPEISDGGWHYFALVRAGTDVYIYRSDGAGPAIRQTDSYGLTDAGFVGTPIAIGDIGKGVRIGISLAHRAVSGGARPARFEGAIGSLRITRGAARYSGTSFEAPSLFPLG